jgi:hypothetical protein
MTRSELRLDLVCTVILAGLLVASPVTGQGAPSEVDLDWLLEEGRRIQREDLQAWGKMAFRRQVTRERLDSQGNVTWTEELDFRVTPTEDGFDELLTSIDGRVPTPKQVREHRKAARFTKRYQAASAGEMPDYDDDSEEEYSLESFMLRPDFIYGGIEEIDGRPCHRLDYEATPDSGGGMEQRVLAATERSIWLETEGLHVLRLESRIVRPISGAMGMAKVHLLNMRIDAGYHGDDWLPTLMEVRSDVRVVFKTLHKRNTFRYTEFEPAG